MIGAKLGHFLDGPLFPIARRIKVSPNIFTVIGFVITVFAAAVMTTNLKTGALLMILGGLFDILDGAVARSNGKVSKFGAYLDSVLDRFSDALLFVSIAWNQRADMQIFFLALGSMIGAFLVSYTRARSEGLGIDSKVGILERPERIVLLSLACLTGWILPIFWIMFVLTYVTVFQRMYHFGKASKSL